MKKLDYKLFNINPPKVKVKPGVLLVAPPYSTDLYFSKTVVLIVKHDDKGSIGFILNRPTEFMTEDMISEISKFDSKIFFGGPVQVDSLHFIHKLGNKISDTEKVKNDIYWGGSFETLYKLINEGKANPYNVKFFLGYSGWAPNQLKNELEMDYWYVVPSNKYDIWADTSNLWKQVILDLGFNDKIIKNIPSDPMLN